MSIALTRRVRQLEKETTVLTERLAELNVEVEKLKAARRPGRPPKIQPEPQLQVADGG